MASRATTTQAHTAGSRGGAEVEGRRAGAVAEFDEFMASKSDAALPQAVRQSVVRAR